MSELVANQAQEEAIRTIDGPLIIISCPGSGKTTTLVRRIHQMIAEGVRPASILMVTFTKAAALGMQQKYASLYKNNPGITFATIHSLCLNILVQEGRYTFDDVMQEDKKESFLIQEFRKAGHHRDAMELARNVSREISAVKSNYINPRTHTPENVSQEIFLNGFDAYEAWRKNRRMIDYDDMLSECLTLLQTEPAVLVRWQNRFEYIQCDEYQDTNYIQRDILYKLAERTRNLCVVGDDDQSIYAFRGSRPEIMLNFVSDFPDAKQVYMSTNYRSAQSIVDTAGNLIEHNRVRFNKEFISWRGEHGAIGAVASMRFDTRKDEIVYLSQQIAEKYREGIPYREMAVLFRTNLQVQDVVSTLYSMNIPYYSTESVTSIYESVIFQDFRDYVGLSCGTGGQNQLLNVINHPNRYLPSAKFMNCPFNHDEMLIRAAGMAKTGQEWRYSGAKKEIDLWFRLFGPGVIDMHDAPLAVLRAFYNPNGLNYQRYCEEYAKERNIDVDDVKQIYSDLEKDAERFSTLHEWFTAADVYTRQLHNQTAKRDRNGVYLTTMHKAKGLEWKVVFIIDANEGINPHKMGMNGRSGIEEERRLFYVAATRAKDDLNILGYGTTSRFVREMLKLPFEEIQEESHPAHPEAVAKTRSLLQERRENYDVNIEGLDEPVRGDEVEHVDFGHGYVTDFDRGRLGVLFDKAGRRVLKWPWVIAKGMLHVVHAVDRNDCGA